MTFTKSCIITVSTLAMMGVSTAALAGNASYGNQGRSSVVSSMAGTSFANHTPRSFVENIPIQFERALADFNAGNYADASRNFHDILAARPADPYANYFMGLSKQKMGNHRKAIRHLSYSKKVFPNAPQVYAALGTSLVADGRHEQARGLLADLDALDRGCADACASAGDISKAKMHLRAAIAGL